MKENIIGKKYGRLTVIDYDGKDGRHVMVKCKCDCGNYIRVRANRVITGHTKSCGCYRRDIRTTHGKRRTKLYSVWNNMRRRCNDTKNSYYKDYGGRGISVCAEWQNSFGAFYEWAQNNGYNDGLTIDRINNNGNYEPANCKWSTVTEQANNRRTSKYIQYQDKSMTIAQWAKYRNIKQATLSNRLNSGWPIEEALGFKKHINKAKRSYTP